MFYTCSLKEHFFHSQDESSVIIFFFNFNVSWVIYKRMTKNGTIFLEDSCRKEIVRRSVTLWNMKCSKLLLETDLMVFPFLSIFQTLKILSKFYDWKHLFGINLSNFYSSLFLMLISREQYYAFYQVCHNKECFFLQKNPALAWPLRLPLEEEDMVVSSRLPGRVCLL